MTAGKDTSLLESRGVKLAPLSYQQEALWFLWRLEGPSDTYNIDCQFNLEGVFNLEAFKAAFSQIIQRHETLRTCFRLVDGEPHQVILESVILPLELRKIETNDGGHLQPHLQEMIRDEKVAIVRFIPRDNSVVRFCALIP